MTESGSRTAAHSFLTGGGEMSQLIQAHDWSESAVGPIDGWPQTLRTTLSILLNARFPMFLFWGPELTCFYNDAYRPSLGNDGKHPAALGQPGDVVWPELWPFIKPLLDRVFTTGESFWSEDQLVPIHRNGRLEEVYWTFSYSPVYDQAETPAGMLVTCLETTEKVTTLRSLQEARDQLFFCR